MPAIIFQGTNEFLVKQIARLSFKKKAFGAEQFCRFATCEIIYISNSEDLDNLVFNQEGLFESSKVYFLENMLRKQYKTLLRKIKTAIADNHFIFVEILPKDKSKLALYKQSFFIPDFLRSLKRKDIDKLISQFAFWQKLAKSLGINLKFREWKEAIELLQADFDFLWTALEQKSIFPSYSLKSLILNWSSGNIFLLTEDLSKGLRQSVLNQLFFFYKQQINPINLWHYINRYFLWLYQIKKDIALIIHPYALKKLKQSANNFSLEELENILSFLMEIDLKIKTGYFEGKSKDWEAIFYFIFSFFGLRSSCFSKQDFFLKPSETPHLGGSV